MQQSNYKAYNKALETLSHVDQIVMMYYVAISYVQQAREALIIKDYDKRFQMLNKTALIIRTMRSDINPTANKEMVEALNNFYAAMDQMINEAQSSESTSICDEIINHLRTIKNQWEVIAKMDISSEMKNNLSNDDVLKDGYDGCA